MIRYRNKLMPPADVNNMKHNFGQANPIRHYRLGNDCSCEIVHKLPYKEPSLLNNSYTKDYCPANSALKKIRNSGGSTSLRTKSNSEYLKSRAMTYEQKKYHYIIDDNETAKNSYSCQSLDNAKCKTKCNTVWKPNNIGFIQDGAVTNSTYLNKKKYNTIQSVANSMSHFDHATMIAHAYSGRSAAPFTLKSKMDNSMIGLFRRRGNKNSIKPGCSSCI